MTEESMFCDENGKPFPRTNKFDMELYNKELEKQAEEYNRKQEEDNAWEDYDEQAVIDRKYFTEKAWKDGAKWVKEHAIEWHKSVERPKGYKQDFDIALKVLNYNTNQIEQDYGYYSVEYDKFYHSKSKFKIIAWCELPQFKDKE